MYKGCAVYFFREGGDIVQPFKHNMVFKHVPLFSFP